ncbi:9898_t:CDS:2 [Funneliformis mosseae]|uniref:9898_t:CDS:1 n=1 Tax=Funneliformis mosseae TaxID=27381 RepID=A0A9N9C9I5_FUNMO|nr:9898_t:CDS:2 [Funneliformis mosseae]
MSDIEESIVWLENSKNYLNHYEYSDFRVLKLIGDGASGSVNLANWKDSDSLFALKSFKEDNISIKKVINEIKLQIKVNANKNVIRFYGIAKEKTEENILLIEEESSVKSSEDTFGDLLIDPNIVIESESHGVVSNIKTIIPLEQLVADKEEINLLIREESSVKSSEDTFGTNKDLVINSKINSMNIIKSESILGLRRRQKSFQSNALDSEHTSSNILLKFFVRISRVKLISPQNLIIPANISYRTPFLTATTTKVIGCIGTDSKILCQVKLKLTALCTIIFRYNYIRRKLNVYKTFQILQQEVRQRRRNYKVLMEQLRPRS